MNQASRLMVRPPRPPGVDTLHYTPRSGLEAIREPGHRRMVASVLASGLVDRMIALTEGFEPPVDIQQARVDAEQLAAEFAAYGVTVPAATTRHITLMRALMVPIADDALALASPSIASGCSRPTPTTCAATTPPKQKPSCGPAC
ncbi:hypothetical protein [Streptomyces sp. NPDC057301]|uniref:hypothetical protein n=1 Tax=Streptomyces sp. NPDC057301 TaxID=3346093 RepID=UPI0036262932